jgi:protein SCO1/2
MKLRIFSRALLTLVLLIGTAHRGTAQATKNTPEPAPAGSAESTYRGGLVSPPLPKPKFTLTDTSGAPFDFALKTQGYTTLLFFGYTHCPDMCPLQMSTIAQAMKKIPPVSADRFRVVFVTTDPDRDSPQILRSWLDHFDKRFIGLTGSQAAIDAAQIAANLSPAKKSAVRPDGAYEVGHAAFVLAYTKDNLAHVIYPVGVKEDDWEHDLPYLAKETWTNR